MLNPRAQKISIKDLARMCNVSTQTVSRVLNKRPDVSPETREYIEKVIDQTGYQPSALARSLVQQRTYTLGVITAGFEYVGVSQTLNGIAERCRTANYTMIIKELSSFDLADIAPVVTTLIAYHVDGIILAIPNVNDAIALTQARLPSFCPPVIFLKSQHSANYPTISIDNFGGALRAVNYLLAVRRRNIGLISGPLDWQEARQRKQGWEAALNAAGERPSRHNWVQGDWSSAGGEAAFADLIHKYPKMDAVFASNDQMALGVLHYANLHGISVPQDLALIGFDDTTEAAFYSPSLTTIRNPVHQMGVLAVEILLAHITASGNIHTNTTLVLPTELVIRQSTPSPEAR